MEKPWKEEFVDAMGLIVCLSGQERFDRMRALNARISMLPRDKRAEVKECLRQRFTPTNGLDGCQSGTDAVRKLTA